MPLVIFELVFVVGLLYAIVGYATGRGALAIWTHSFGAMLRWLHDHARISIPGTFGHRHIHFGGMFSTADNFVQDAIRSWCEENERLFSFCLHGLTRVFTLTAEAIDFLARETSQTFEWLVHVHLPKRLRHAIEAAFPAALLARLIAHAVARAIPAVRREVHTVTHEVAVGTVLTVTRVVHAAVAFPPWALRLPHRVGRVEGEVSNLTKRLHKVEGIAAAGVFAGLLANALGISLRCVRRGNMSKAAKGVCGMDSGLLGSLLGDALAIVGLISVVEFAEGLLAIEDEAVKILAAGIREFPG